MSGEAKQDGRPSRREASLALAAIAMGAPAPTAHAADEASSQQLKARMRDVMHAWDGLDPASAAPFYAKDPGLVFYDDSPLKYTGWAEYARGVPKEFAAYKTFSTTLGNDIEAHVLGNFAWGIATWRADAVKKDGSSETVYGRWTVLFDKRDTGWLIIHEHVSVPTP